jgi:hypothetical protein
VVAYLGKVSWRESRRDRQTSERSSRYQNLLVVRSYFHLLYDYHRQRTQLGVVKLRQLVVDTINGYEPLPTDWVQMTEEQRDEWLDEHGADSTGSVELYIREVA